MSFVLDVGIGDSDSSGDRDGGSLKVLEGAKRKGESFEEHFPDDIISKSIMFLSCINLLKSQYCCLLFLNKKYASLNLLSDFLIPKTCMLRKPANNR